MRNVHDGYVEKSNCSRLCLMLFAQRMIFSAYSPRLKIDPVDKLFPHILKVLDMLCSYDLTPFNAN